MTSTKVTIKVGSYYVKERSDLKTDYPVYVRIMEEKEFGDSAIFTVDMNNILSGTTILGESGNYMSSRSGRWTIYGMGDDQDIDKRTWSLATANNILMNKDDGNGLTWEEDDGITVLREKVSDDDCLTAEFFPIDDSKVTVERDEEFIMISANTTTKKQSTGVAKTETLQTVTEVFRESFYELSTKVSYEWSSNTKAGGTGTPSTAVTSKFSAELAAKGTWTDRKTETVTKSNVVTIPITPLNSMTGIAIKRVTDKFYMDDRVLLMIDQQDTQVIVPVDANGAAVPPP